MNLDEEFYQCLKEFTNANNDIRKAAECTFDELIEQNSGDQVLSSLINIINSNPQSNVSFSALIQLKTLSFRFIFSKDLDDEYLVFFRNTILNFFISLRFSQDMRRYLLCIIFTIYVFSSNPGNLPFPEFGDFLESALEIPELYADIMEFFYNFFDNSQIQNLFNFEDEEKIQFIFSHLDSSCTQLDRSYTLVFIFKFWKSFSSDFTSLTDLLSILNELDSQYFSMSISSFVLLLLDGKIDFDVKFLYELLYIRIVDEENDEIFRQLCLFHFSNIICFNKSFYQYTISEMPSFINLILVLTYNPHKYPILYEEVRFTITNILNTFSNTPPLAHLIMQLMEEENIYVSSFSLSYVILTDYIENGILCATNEDRYIRKNGLRYIKKILKYNMNQLYLMGNDTVEEIGSALLDIFEKYKEQFALKVFAIWCDLVQSVTLSKFVEQIDDLCSNVLTFETIKCGAALLRLNDSRDKDESDESALFLLQNACQILSPDYQLPPDISMSLSDLVECLPDVTLYVSMEDKIEFMNFLIPFVCDDKDSFFSEGFSRLLIQLDKNIDIYEVPVMCQLFNILENSLNNSDCQSVSNSLTSISRNAIYFSNFEQNYLQIIYNICSNIISERNSPTVECIPEAIGVMREMLSRFKENEDLYNSLFEVPFNLFFDEDEDIFTISSSLKLIKKMTHSKFFDDERSLFTLEHFKSFFDHCSELIIKMKEGENVIQMYESTEFLEVSDCLFKIFSSIFVHCPEESCQLIRSEFLHLDDFFLELRTSIANIYLEILQKDEDVYSKDFEDQLLQNLLNVISMIPTDQEVYQEFEEQLSSSEIPFFYSLQNLVISGLGNLFFQEKIDIELVDQLIEILITIASFKIETDLNGEYVQLQSNCILCLSKLIYKYKLVKDKFDEKAADLILLVFQSLPSCSKIDNLEFFSIFNILLFCISTNVLNDDETIQGMLNVLCECIRENKVKSEVLRTIVSQNSNSGNEVIDMILLEIHNFLD